ncbi:MAG: hypothetical protein JW731_15180 [Bacteroidales bacterium]|nr:hypothetical protein [Bacteroidales bacterium]
MSISIYGIFFLATCNCAAGQNKVLISEGTQIIPSYKILPPDANPRFYDGRNTQGAQGRIYPYPMYDRLSDNKPYYHV